MPSMMRAICSNFQPRLVPRRYTLGLAECEVHLTGYLVEAFLLADLVEVAAGVEVEHGESQLLGALHFVEEGGAAFLQGLLVG